MKNTVLWDMCILTERCHCFGGSLLLPSSGPKIFSRLSWCVRPALGVFSELHGVTARKAVLLNPRFPETHKIHYDFIKAITVEA
jgi:hypothetical protein